MRNRGERAVAQVAGDLGVPTNQLHLVAPVAPVAPVAVAPRLHRRRGADVSSLNIAQRHLATRSTRIAHVPACAPKSGSDSWDRERAESLRDVLDFVAGEPQGGA
jgi:hypothetical protein